MVDKAVKQINPTTYEVEMPSGDKVEIGDKEALDFKPHLKLNRWGGECFISVGLPTAEKITPIIEAGKVKWRGQKVEARFYPLEPRTVIAKDKDGRDRQVDQNELGGFEFEITLKEKPVTNQIVLNIDTKGLRFSYQSPLTQQQIERGDIRPDNIVGSYAIYHATRGNIHRDAETAEKYKAGKAFHIYRPQAEDADSKKVWCSIHIDEQGGKLIITIPQQFLDEAVYPVTVDPDFGKTDVGGSTAAVAGEDNPNRLGTSYTMGALGGTANYIKAYLLSTATDTVDCKVFINETNSGGAGNHGQIAGPVENLGCAAAAHWEEFTLSDEALTADVDYLLNIAGNGADVSAGEQYRIKYDFSAAFQYCQEIHDYGAPENPWLCNLVGGDPDDWESFSIYCNYTEPSVGLENKSANMGAKMIAGKLI